jgi:peptidoglycan/LPS O-acetylase OafA/YrhL
MPARLDAFGFGAICAIAARGTPEGRLRRFFGRTLFVSFAVLTVALVCVGALKGGSMQTLATALKYTVFASGSATLIWFAATSSSSHPLIRLLTSRPLRALGKFSYGLYVLHVPMIPILYVLMLRLMSALRCNATSELAAVVAFDAFGTVCSVTVAMMSWHLFEKHFLRLKGRFGYGVPSSNRS